MKLLWPRLTLMYFLFAAAGVLLTACQGEAEPGCPPDSDCSASVPLPDVRDLRVGAATRKLERAGFNVSVSRAISESPRGLVIEQDPLGGNDRVYPAGAEVDITVSDGP